MIKKISTQSLAGSLLIIASCAFGYVLLDGGKMLAKFRDQQQKIAVVAQELAVLEAEVATLKKEIVAWEQQDFALEKMAREQLLLGRSVERVYLVS